MATTIEEQRTVATAIPTLSRWVSGFLKAKRSQRKAPGTLEFYEQKLSAFVHYCEGRGVTTIHGIDPMLLREFLISLEESGHNAGGTHAYHRAIRVFLRWYEVEADDDGWRNPIKKVAAPKVPEQILDPIDRDDVWRMFEACGRDKLGLRNRAIILTLYDTGVRAKELTDINLNQFDPITGAILIERGKGGKPRFVFVGRRTRKAIRAWLKVRGDRPGPLFTTRSRERLRYNGLRTLIRRCAAEAGVKMPPLHSFRRGFTLAMLRAGTDLLTLQKLVGHSDLSVLKRYAKQTVDDLQAAHAAHSPVDREVG